MCHLLAEQMEKMANFTQGISTSAGFSTENFYCAGSWLFHNACHRRTLVKNLSEARLQLHEWGIMHCLWQHKAKLFQCTQSNPFRYKVISIPLSTFCTSLTKMVDRLLYWSICPCQIGPIKVTRYTEMSYVVWDGIDRLSIFIDLVKLPQTVAQLQFQQIQHHI